MNKFIVLVSCFTILFCLSGCDKGKGLKTEYVDGVVTLDGTPLTEGASVRFIPAVAGKGEPAGGFTDKNGVYRLSSVSGDPEKGALEGEYKIVVSKMDTTMFEKDDTKAPKDDRGNQKLSVSKEILPKVYTQAQTTPLTYTVVKGKQKHNIELTSSK